MQGIDQKKRKTKTNANVISQKCRSKRYQSPIQLQDKAADTTFFPREYHALEYGFINSLSFSTFGLFSGFSFSTGNQFVDVNLAFIIFTTTQ